MAHDKIYGICGDKCPVDITDLIAKKRLSFKFDTIAANQTVTRNASTGLNTNAGVAAIVTPTNSSVDDRGFNLLDMSYYISDSGEFVLIIRNRTTTPVTDYGVEVTII